MTPYPARFAIALAGLSGALAIAGGAFGAHGLADPALKALLQTAAEYQLGSAAAALGALALAGQGVRGARLAALLLLAGGLVFGASLDAIVFTGVRAFGAVTPIGGVLMIAGFAWLAVSALVRRDS